MANLTSDTRKNTRSTILGSNPVLSKLSRLVGTLRDTDPVAATYNGIFTKTVYFLLVTIIAILLYTWLNQTVFQIGGFNVTLNRGEGDSQTLVTLHFAIPEILFGLLSLILTIAMPFVCAASISAIPVCGTIYCVSEGYLISLLLFKLLAFFSLDSSIGLVALLLTVLVVGVMAFLYTKRIIKTDKKFYMILFTAAGAVILGSLLYIILYFIPFTRPFIASFMSNPAIGILSAAISVIIASMFLISDFAVIESCVTEKLPKKYEWMASFGLAFTVIWLYLKILELLIRILGRSGNSK